MEGRRPAGEGPLRILLGIHFPLDPHSGAAGCNLRLGEALRHLGHEVSVVGADDVPFRTGNKMDELTYPVLFTGRVVQALRRGAVDVVDATTGDLWPLHRRFTRGVEGVTITRTYGLEHLEVAQATAAAMRGEVRLRRRYDLYYGGLRLRMVARSLRVADAALFPNRGERTWATGHLGLDPSRAFFIRAGLATPFLGLPAPSDSSGDGLGIAVIGPYMWRKGAHTAVAVLERVLGRQESAHATWLGATAEELLPGLPVTIRPRVSVIRRYELQDLPALLQGHHVLLVLSHFEGYPGVIMEGMACGLAVVATDIPGSHDILEGTGAGLLVEPAAAESTALAVERLASDRVLLDRMRRRGHELAQDMSWDGVAKETESLYRSLLRAKRG